MNRIILIKHAQPAIDPTTPAHQWRLSPSAHQACTLLAKQLEKYALEHIYASQEPKAARTAEYIAAYLGVGWETAADLHEHERPREPFSDEAGFRESIGSLFAHPDRIVYGDESADRAQERFDAALERIIAADKSATHAIVAHGTVISLWIASRTGMDAHALWKRLGLPSYVAMDLESGEILEIIEKPA